MEIAVFGVHESTEDLAFLRQYISRYEDIASESLSFTFLSTTGKSFAQRVESVLKEAENGKVLVLNGSTIEILRIHKAFDYPGFMRTRDVFILGGRICERTLTLVCHGEEGVQLWPPKTPTRHLATGTVAIRKQGFERQERLPYRDD